MKIQLGLLGADDSVQQIENIAQEYPQIQLQSVVYWRETDIINLLKPKMDSVHMWLFSGQVPYSIAQEWGQVTVPTFFVSHTGASLYKTLLYLSHEKHLRVSQMSFDTFRFDELSSLLNEVGIPDPFKLHHYTGSIDFQMLVKYHYDLWAQGKTKAAITCLRSAHIELIRLGVPAYHIVPARDAIVNALESVIQTHDMINLRNAQIAVQLIDFSNAAADDTVSAQRSLRQYSKTLHGVFTSLNNGDVEVITTRGPVEEVTSSFSCLPSAEMIPQALINRIICGIGVGQTVSQARKHAHAALRHAQNRGAGSWYCMLGDNTIIGPLDSTRKPLIYSYSDSTMQEISQKVSLSVSTLSKLLSVIQRVGPEICANELGEIMGILPRSARRILMILEQSGFAEVIGEQAPHLRGRPSKIYRIHLDKS